MQKAVEIVVAAVSRWFQEIVRDPQITTVFLKIVTNPQCSVIMDQFDDRLKVLGILRLYWTNGQSGQCRSVIARDERLFINWLRRNSSWRWLKATFRHRVQPTENLIYWKNFMVVQGLHRGLDQFVCRLGGKAFQSDISYGFLINREIIFQGTVILRLNAFIDNQRI